MSEATTARPKLAGVLKPDADPETDGKDGDGGVMGKLLDVAGICAGVLLAVIVADMLSKGRISRALLRRKPGGCDDCGDQPEGPVPGDS